GTPWPFEKKTMAHYFARAGYMTALVGKMHFVDAQTHGFDYHLDFNDWFQFLGPKAKLHAEELGKRNSGSGNPQIDDLWRDFGDPWEGVREKDDRKGAVHIGRMSKITERDQFESFVARESVRFLKNHGNKQPFFLVSSFLKPHDPFMPAERFYNMYRGADMVLPDTWGKLDPSVPRETKEAVRRAAGEGLDAPENAKQRTACYYGSVSEMDFCLGQVLDALHELGLEENTVVVYTSDHGEMLGEHGLWHKFVFYDPSCGVPLIFRVPGLTTAGARSQTPVSLVQMVPTLLELCGLPAPAEADGESFVRDLREPTSRRDTTVYSEYNLRTPRAKYMIRRGDHKYNYYTNDTPELYNLREDPKETRNLAESEKGKAEELKAQLFAWHKPGSEK
ncbi:MAG: sulfatase-like hydrolase/transferase, partial [Acidobacteria bacterium]|nr:sulfatase-like hydrolase/transferase [Acidobacteriota bacterium]